MPNNVVRFGSVGELIDKLNASYERDEIEGLIVCIKYKADIEDCFGIGWTGTLGYLERLALLEAAKGECHYKALCADC